MLVDFKKFLDPAAHTGGFSRLPASSRAIATSFYGVVPVRSTIHSPFQRAYSGCGLTPPPKADRLALSPLRPDRFALFKRYVVNAGEIVYFNSTYKVIIPNHSR